MRIAVVETSAFGGLLHYATQLADGLALRGHEVDLVVPRGNELASFAGAARRRAVLAPHVRRPGAPPAGRVASFVRRAGIALRLVRSWARISWVARTGRYDALITGADVSISVGAVGMWLLMRLPGRPPVVKIAHNVRTFARRGSTILRDDGFFVRMAAVGTREAALAVVHGERSRTDLQARFPDVPIVVVPHGDEELFAGEGPPPPTDDETVLYFGDWRRYKGLPLLMEAFDLLAARRPSARLLVAGTPAPSELDPATVHSWAAGHGDRVEVVDRYVPVEEVRGIFGRSRVVCLPYVTINQSGVAHLAMTMARPIVATAVGDLPEVVHDGETGVLVPSGDAAALADALERVLADADLAARMGAAGRNRLAAGASWDVVAGKLDAAMQEVGLG